MLMDFRDAKGAALSYDPRAILERVLLRFREIDLTPVTAHELEFYLIDGSRDERGRPQPPLNPRSHVRENAPSVYGLDDLDRYRDFDRAADAAAMQRVPVSAASEYAPGNSRPICHRCAGRCRPYVLLARSSRRQPPSDRALTAFPIRVLAASVHAVSLADARGRTSDRHGEGE
jgi:glutamine synthetase